MKRVVFAFVLFFVLIVFNFFCLDYIQKIKNEATEKLDILYRAVIDDTTEKIALECENFEKYWFSKQHILCLIVRHDLLDRATFYVSGFAPLAEFDETGKLASEIKSCRFVIEEIWDSERPLFRNIF